MTRRKINIADRLQAQTTNLIRLLADKQLDPEVKVALLKTHKEQSVKQFDEWIHKLEEEIKQ